jgi:hypothetical protein
MCHDFNPGPKDNLSEHSAFDTGPAAILWLVFLGAYAKLRKATFSFVMSVRLSAHPHERTSVHSGRIFMKFDIFVFFLQSAENKRVS